jgi:hypothetical protein
MKGMNLNPQPRRPWRTEDCSHQNDRIMGPAECHVDTERPIYLTCFQEVPDRIPRIDIISIFVVAMNSSVWIISPS